MGNSTSKNGELAPGSHPASQRAAAQTVAVFMVRHGERVDETEEGKVWRQRAGNRWFDPPLTQRGKQQAAQAAAELKAYLALHSEQFAPFERVYCSPLLRTMQTAEQFARELELPVSPVPGIATCTASFKVHGPTKNVLLPFRAIVKSCEHAHLIESFDHEYDLDAETGHFVPTIARLASAACAAHQLATTFRRHSSINGGGTSNARSDSDSLNDSQSMKGAQKESVNACVSHDAIQGALQDDGENTDDESPSWAFCCGRAASGRSSVLGPCPTVLIVTHREGLRDVGLLTSRPFMKTRYCGVAIFSYNEHDGWSTLHNPEEFEALKVPDETMEAAPSLIGRSSSRASSRHSSPKRNTQNPAHATPHLIRFQKQ